MTAPTTAAAISDGSFMKCLAQVSSIVGAGRLEEVGVAHSGRVYGRYDDVVLGELGPRVEESESSAALVAA